ncbi:MAG: YceH family protein [Gemmatimonadaceae bacterium]
MTALNAPLSDVEIRVLGALIEKAMSTPDYYPLSLNALTNACNQSSNRDPIVAYEEATVSHALDDLRRRSLVRSIKRADSRVTKFQHLIEETLNLDAREMALLCTLMLRGPQTVAELKTRTARLTDVGGLSDVESVLTQLMERAAGALATRLPRRPGQKEGRYAHLLGGDVTYDEPDPVPTDKAADDDRISALETATQELKDEVADLRAQLEAFRKQFE